MRGLAIRIACATVMTAILSLSVAIVASGIAFAQQPAAARAGRIAIQPFGPASLPADLRSRLDDAAATGLRASGTEVLSTNDLARVRINAGLGPCTDRECEQRLGKLADIRYWLRGTCQVDGSTYRLHLELVDVRTGGVRAARDDTCDICTEADAGETTNVAASALKAALARASGPATHGTTATGSVGPTLSQQAGVNGAGADPHRPAASIESRAQESAGVPLWRRLLPWTAFTAAAAAVAGGAYYLAIDNRGYGCKGAGDARNCAYYNDTVWRWGVPLIAAGAVLATTGLVLLLTGGSGDQDAIEITRFTGSAASVKTSGTGSSTQIVISPDRVGLAGTF